MQLRFIKIRVEPHVEAVPVLVQRLPVVEAPRRRRRQPHRKAHPALAELEAVDVDNRSVAPRLGMFVDICKYSLPERGDLVRRRPGREVDRDAQRT